jgi:hypothetical protein
MPRGGQRAWTRSQAEAFAPDDMAALLRTALSEVVDMDTLAAAASRARPISPPRLSLSVLILGIIELADEPVEHLTYRQGQVVRIFRENG